MLVLSGSGPSGCAPTLYGKIARLMQQRHPCVVDATGKLLANALEAGPFLVKPNKEELEDLLGRKLATEADLVEGPGAAGNRVPGTYSSAWGATGPC